MISLIVAFDQNQLIGNKNRLPWHFKEDLSYFKKTTMGHDILMGRKTFESILSYRNQPLPGRHHYVLTREKTYDFEQVTLLDDLTTFLADYPADKELFIIGGSSLYEQVLPCVDRLYVTHIEGMYEGDAYFPAVNWKEWTCLKEESASKLRFVVYERGSTECY